MADQNAATTMADDEIKTPIASEEQSSLRPIDNEDSARVAAPDDEPASQSGKVKPQDAPPSPKQSRADRVEEIAAGRRKEAQQEQQAVSETFTKSAPPPAPVVDQAAKVTLKVLGATMAMSIVERDELAKEVYKGDISRVPEDLRNEYAQMAASKKEYAEKELAAARKAYQSVRDNGQPAASTRPTEAAAPAVEAEAKETPDQKRRRALEIIQTGGDLDAANALLDEAESERFTATLETRDRDRQTSDAARNYDTTLSRMDDLVEERLPGFKANYQARALVDAETTQLQRQAVAHFLNNADDATWHAFEQAGWSSEALATMPANTLADNYKQLVINGHRVPPAHELRAAAVGRVLQAAGYVPKAAGASTPNADHIPGPDVTTQPTVNVDRSARKDSLVQPERATLPRANPTRQSPPRSENDRAAAARAETRAQRRAR